MITKLAFVAQPTRDMEKAKAFYSMLGLTKQSDYPGGWVEFDAGDGNTIALDAFSPKASQDAGPYLALETDDMEAEIARLKAEGVTVTKDVWENKSEAGDGICKMALIADPDGNPILLHQIDPSRT